MMKKRRNSGFTLIEMLVVVVIVVLLGIGIGTGVDAGVRAYKSSVFESNSAILSDILNTTIGDALRYSENVEYTAENERDFKFTSYDYGVKKAVFAVVDGDNQRIEDGSAGYVAMLGQGDSSDQAPVLMINEGAYAKNLLVKDLKITAHPVKEIASTALASGGTAAVGFYFDVEYTIISTENDELSHTYTLRVRQANADVVEIAGSEISYDTPDDPSAYGESYVIEYIGNTDSTSPRMNPRDAEGPTDGRVLKKLNVKCAKSSDFVPADSNNGDVITLYDMDRINCTNYTFIGWNTEPDGTGHAYDPGAKVKFGNLKASMGEDRELQLYAQWSYTITFRANPSYPSGHAGVGNMTDYSATVPCGSTVTLAPLEFQKAYQLNHYLGTKKIASTYSALCNFKWWSTMSSDTDPDNRYPDQAPVNFTGRGDTDLYAIWDDLDRSASYATGFTEPLPADWKMEGWLREGGSTPDTAATVTLSATTKVYASLKRTIIYKANCPVSEAVSPAQQTYHYGDAAPTLPIVSRKGYGLDGWFTEAEGGTKITAENLDKAFEGSGGTVTLYAHWGPVKYTVKYDPNGADGSIPSFTKYYGQNHALSNGTGISKSMTVTYDVNGGNALAQDKKTVAWSFLGWSEAQNAVKAQYTGTMNEDPTSQADISITIYAVWDKSAATFTLPTPTDPGREFAGWYTAKTGGTFVGNGGASYTATDSTTLYAHWKEQYTVTYDYAGGSGSPASATVIEGNAVTLPTPTRTDYTFTGWYTAQGSKVGDAGGRYTVSGSITLYAHWQYNVYKIFVTNSDTGDTMEFGTYKKSNQQQTVTIDGKNGYTFARTFSIVTGSPSGVSIDRDGTLTIPANTTGDITVKCTWNEVRYTVTLDVDGGSRSIIDGPYLDVVLRTVTDTYKTSTSTQTMEIHGSTSKSGYNFGGWVIADSSENKSAYIAADTTITIPANSFGNIDVVAKWDPKTYTITLDPNGGVGSSQSQTSYQTSGADQPVSINAGTRTGYEFTGWTVTADSTSSWFTVSGNTLTIPANRYGNITVKANWKIIDYTVTLDENGGDGAYLRSEYKVIGGRTYYDDDTYNISDADQQITIQGDSSRTGYTFLGWTITENTSGRTSTVSGNKITIPAGAYGNITVKAQWKAVTYTINFNVNGAGGNAPASVTKTYGTPILLNNLFRNYTATFNDRGTTTSQTAAWQFNGWCANSNGSGTVYTGTLNADLSSTQGDTKTLYAIWSNTNITLPTPAARTGYTFDGWYTAESGGDKIGDGGASYKLNANMTLYAHWTLNSYKITVTQLSNATITVKYGSTSTTVGKNNSVSVPYGTSVTISVKYSRNSNQEYEIKDANGNTYAKDTPFSMPACDVTVQAGSGCVTPDTLITLADGTKKRVDELTGEELLLVWNLETGSYDVAPMVFVDSESAADCTVMHVVFSDGTDVGVVTEHGFFDLDLGQYVYINEDTMNDYIGHRFVKQADLAANTWGIVTLTDVWTETVYTKVYSPVTFGHLCYFTNGVLSMPGGIGGLFNIFDVDTRQMTYDAARQAADLEEYGVFTYDDYDGIIPEIAYEAFNGAWLKVAIEKGLLSWEDIAYLAERYAPFFG